MQKIHGSKNNANFIYFCLLQHKSKIMYAIRISVIKLQNDGQSMIQDYVTKNNNATKRMNVNDRGCVYFLPKGIFSI